MIKFAKRCVRSVVLLGLVLCAAGVQAGTYMTVKATVPEGLSGSGKVYAQEVLTGEQAPAAPDSSSFVKPEFKKQVDSKGDGDDGRRFDVYYYAQAEEGSEFEGWYSDAGLSTLVSTDNPYVWENHNYSDAARWAKFVSAGVAYEGPEDFIGGDESAPADWFRKANWSHETVPTYPEIVPTIPAGQRAVFDADQAEGGKDAVIGNLHLGTSGNDEAGELMLDSGSLTAKLVYIGQSGEATEAGGCGRLVQNGGRLAIQDGKFYIGYASGSESWSEYVMNGGTCTGANTDTGLVVGNYGKGRFILNGGTYTQSGDVHVSRFAGSQGEVFVRGGTFELRENSNFGYWYDNPLKLGEAEYAYLEVTGDGKGGQGKLDLEDGLRIGHGSVAKVLTDGIALLNYIWDWSGDHTGVLVLDGGTVKYRGGRRNNENNNLNFINGLAAVRLGAAGGTVDDSGATVVIHTPISADPDLAGDACGMLVKRGTGTLVLPTLAPEVSVRIEEGAIGLAEDNAFTADQLVFPEESAGACAIDLYGNALVWSDFAKVTEFRNTASRQATLIVESEGDTDLTQVKFVGDIKVLKRGTGRLKLKDTGVAALAVEEGAVEVSVGYRHYRVKCESLMTWCGFADGWAMSEFAFFAGEKKLEVRPEMIGWDAETLVDGRTHRDGCGPAALFDGDYETYLMDVRGRAEGHDLVPTYAALEACWFTVDFGESVPVTRYTWHRGPEATRKGTVVGDIYDTNDPTRLRLYGSDDGEHWVELSNNSFARGGGESDSRSTNEEPKMGGDVTLPGRESAFGYSAVSVAGGASLAITGADVRVGSLETAPGAEVDLGGNRFVIDGASSELKGFVNVPVVLDKGVTGVGGLWYRFTVLRVGWNHSEPQLAELSLYDADGERINAGLVDCGDGVAPRDMPYGSCSQAEAYGYGPNAGPAALFDGRQTAEDATVWHPNRGVNDDWSSPVVVTMRLAPGCAPAATHALVVHKGSMNGQDNYWNTPHIWTLEVSADGETWSDVYRRETMYPDADLADYKEIVLANTPVDLSWPNSFGPDFTATVNADATLVVTGGSSAIASLVLDCASGCGTIDGFNPAPGGTLRIVNAPAGFKPQGALGWTVLNAVNATNLLNWRVFVEGVEKGAHLRLIDGKITLLPDGFVIIVR